MSAQHTPGPWDLDRSGFIREARGPDGCGILIASACDLSRSASEGEANARLIAAAPELLAALEALCREFSVVRRDLSRIDNNAGHDSSHEREAAKEVLRLARAAIAKARGES